MTMTLDPLVFADGDPNKDPAVYRANSRFWWHESIASELRRVRDECTNPATGKGYSAFSVSGIAGNLNGMYASDVAKYCRQMIAWGELSKADPLWDFEPDLWVSLVD